VSLLQCPKYTNLTWTVSIEYIAYLVLLVLETSDARTVILMMFDIVTKRVIPSLADSLSSSYPHINTLLNDTFVCFLFSWELRVIFWRSRHSDCYIPWGRAKCLAKCLANQLRLPFFVRCNVHSETFGDEDDNDEDDDSDATQV